MVGSLLEVLPDEIQKLGHSRINRWVVLKRTAIAPGNDSDDTALVHQRTARVTLTGVLTLVTRTDVEW